MKVYMITADADHECNTPIRAYAVRKHATRRP